MEEFDRHWGQHINRGIAPSKIAVGRRFLAPLIDALNYTDGCAFRILDAGCGDGVHASVIAQSTSEFTYRGIDISQVAIRLCTEAGFDRRFHFEVGDVAQIASKDGVYDAVICYGVVAYMSNPALALKELSRVLRKGGLMGIWIYPRKRGIVGSVFNIVRAACALGGARFSRFVADLIVPFLRVLPVSSQVHLGNASWAQCREVVLVNIAPTSLIFPTKEEILEWVRDAGLTVVHDRLESPVELWMRKG